MRILHIVEDFSIKSGGLRTVIKNLDFFLKKMGHKSYIIASDKEKSDAIFVVKSTTKWLYSQEWKKSILTIINEQKIEVVHIHGAWLYPQYIGAKIAVENKIPMVLSLHGMFQPWLWKKGTLKKKLYFNLLSKKYFSKALVFHTITPIETETIKRFFKKSNSDEIPNLISIAEQNNKVNFTEKNILYLGRLNKTKGIDILIKAFSKIDNNKVKLQIAGGFNKYKKELEEVVESLNLKDKVIFLGEVKGEVKTKLIKNAWVMASPSFSDVIGMVNLEAASLKTPMITTYNTGLKPEWNLNGGKLINPNIQELTDALKETLSWSLEKRNAKGKLLYNYVKKVYSWDTRLKDWQLLYEKAIFNEK
ncbi:glycosyltransferase [uncultured Polaribacter sp.]|uniref:glycosyltransferase n=1 Tax=uncultured Polaribacter sp. TaxID=174711 RepID=UPI00261A1A3D|nr:glycosyltransferase [uncultured Polaribacter sp.]